MPSSRSSWSLAAQEGFDPEEVEGALDEAGHGPLPVLAVVGRPNVGKSTLVNRIIGRREAVVQDKPGVTRDRVSYEAEWAGRRFKVVDTGGWEQDVLGLDASVAAQAEYAIETADAVVFVVDSTVGATDTDEAVVKLLRRVRQARRPLRQQGRRTERRGGRQRPVVAGPRRALPGLLAARPRHRRHAGRGPGGPARRPGPEVRHRPRRPRRIALIGRPNVGKSSLLNKVAGEDRVVVNEQAGTTRDPVDELIKLGGITWKFIDTAGIRRRVHLQEGADYYASLRTAAAVEKAEVAVVLIDSSESISVQDQRIITMAVEAGRALVVAFNKWDTLDEERRYYLEREIETNRADRLGPARQRLGPHRPPHGEAGPGDRDRDRGLGDPRPHRPASTPSSVRSSPPTRTRSVAASSRASSSAPRRAPSPRASCSSPPASWSTATAASSSAVCARSSASRAPRSTSPSGSARSAAATSSTSHDEAPGRSHESGPGLRRAAFAAGPSGVP